MASLRGRLTYANVIATVALFVAIGGTSYAVSHLSGKQIRKHSIPGNRVKNNALGRAQIKESKLGPVPNAALAANAARLGGQDPIAFLRYGTSVPSGETITGAFNVYGLEEDTAGNPAGFDFRVVGFPVPAPERLADEQVNFSPADPAKTGDEDPACSGSLDNPTAPPGKVCLYPLHLIAAPNSAAGYALGGSRYGFAVQASAGALTPSSATLQVDGVWAYTAP